MEFKNEPLQESSTTGEHESTAEEISMTPEQEIPAVDETEETIDAPLSIQETGDTPPIEGEDQPSEDEAISDIPVEEDESATEIPIEEEKSIFEALAVENVFSPGAPAEGYEALSEESPVEKDDTVEAALQPLEKRVKKPKWIVHKFSEEIPPVAPFDMKPVTDIIIRRAVEDGVRNSRDLAVYRLTEDWQDLSKNTLILASLLQEGANYAVWTPPKRRKSKSGEETKEESSDSKESVE